ncbi:MAG: LytR/AlgR family response regulator transcription factor [Vulcanimicrobiaceae bacterium]
MKPIMAAPTRPERLAKISALVVDDEALVRSELIYALKRIASDVEVVEADDAHRALELLRTQRFDVLFIDIRMPELDGLETVRILRQLPSAPSVVFVTAHDDHALEAFDLGAVDYLLKPVKSDRLAATLARVRAAQGAPAGQAEPPAARKLPVDVDGRTVLLRVEDIRYCSMESRSVMVHTYDAAFRFRGTLADVRSRLDPYGFVQTHRGFLVNPEHVLEISPFFAGSYVVRVGNKERSQVPVSRSCVAQLRRVFSV